MPRNPQIAPPWQPRFTVAGIMLATLVCAVAAAGVGYLVRYRNEGRWGTLIFLLITLAGPLVLMVLVSITRSIVLTLNRPRKRKRTKDGDVR